MIPEEAVEAAALVVYRTSGRKRVMSYEQARPMCEDDARAILEAAAPHLMAAAWDEGYEGAVDAYDGRNVSNPYRKAPDA